MSFVVVRTLRNNDPFYDPDFVKANERVVLGTTESRDMAELSVILLTGLDRSDNMFKYAWEPDD